MTRSAMALCTTQFLGSFHKFFIVMSGRAGNMYYRGTRVPAGNGISQVLLMVPNKRVPAYRQGIGKRVPG